MNQGATPWYRQRWPWILMAGPAVVVVAGFITAFLAVKSWDGLVADDYYKEGLGINQVKTRDHHASESGVSAQVMVSGKMVQIFLHAKEGEVFPGKVRLSLVHPTRNGLDQSITLDQEGAGFYRGLFKAEPEGRFNALLEDEKGTWRLTGDWKPHGDGESFVLNAGGSQSPKP